MQRPRRHRIDNEVPPPLPVSGEELRYMARTPPHSIADPEVRTYWILFIGFSFEESDSIVLDEPLRKSVGQGRRCISRDPGLFSDDPTSVIKAASVFGEDCEIPPDPYPSLAETCWQRSLEMASSEKPQPPSPCNPCLTPEDTSHKSPGEVVAPYCRPILACRVLEDTSHKSSDGTIVHHSPRVLASCKPCRAPEDTSHKPLPETPVPRARPFLASCKPCRRPEDTSLKPSDKPNIPHGRPMLPTWTPCRAPE
uniref:Uncharacterized protein n=1 Tax=Steinernema glaseri TaxID=37863 RepID=A0A1I8A6C5_9BILA